ncbi:hypothetical protein HWV62_39359 [Athelia sp. TMB]|nr:hypothetical protein HWV62_41088 [Athelia sp. TMB]KAF7980234.1 hypothetical protein HWV62_39359 [Athelia sp. TMB]
MTSIDKCPTELLHLIFSYACTDGDHTARSLSAVSRYIRDCSQPYYNVQSVALHGTRQTLAFADTLEKNPAHLGQIKNLFVSSDSADGLDVNNGKKPEGRSVLAHLRLQFSPRMMSMPKQSRVNGSDSDLDFARALFGILMKIYSSLKTMTITFDCSLRSPVEMADMATLELPNLTELSLAYHAPTDAAFDEFIFKAPLSFPALKRLDLTGLTHVSYQFTPQLCGRLGKIAPNLTHLHIPTTMALANFRKGMPPQRQQGATPPAADINHLSPTIQRVLIALREGGVENCWIPDWGACDCWHCELSEVSFDDRIIVVPGRGTLTWEKLKNRLEVEWENRAIGGKGCWNERSVASWPYDVL